MILTLLLRINNDQTLSEEEKVQRMEAVNKCGDEILHKATKTKRLIDKERDKNKKAILSMQYFAYFDRLRCAAQGLDWKTEVSDPFLSDEEKLDKMANFIKELREEARQRKPNEDT